MLRWLSQHIESANFATSCFALLHRQYSLAGELSEALKRTFVLEDSFEVDVLNKVGNNTNFLVFGREVP